MGAAIVLLLVGLGSLAAGVLIGRYYVPDDRQLRRTAKHSRAYMRALSHLIARDHDTVIDELRMVVEENVEEVEPYFALGAMFRSRGEHERAIRVHQALALRERDRRKLRQRAMYELGLDFRAAGMPRRATRAMEEVLLEEPAHEGALRALAALYEEQARFNEAAQLWHRLGKRRGSDTSHREHHLLVAAAQAALARADLDSAKQLLKAAQRLRETAHFYAAAAELAAARDNHRGTKERLRQALVAEPALAPHLLAGLIAAEEGLVASGKASRESQPSLGRDELDDAPGQDGDTRLLPSGETALQTSAPSVELPGVPLVPASRPIDLVTERVLETLVEVERQTGPRLELALIRAQLQPPGDAEGRIALARQLVEQFPDALAARVATARLALTGGDAAAIKAALEVFVADEGALAWAVRGRWQCGHCGHRPGAFSWRCGQCRRWSLLRMETGIEPPPVPSRERRAQPRAPRTEGLLGSSPDESLPAATLDPGLSVQELARAGTRRSLLGKVGNWVSNVWRRDRDRPA
jgi:lipopolysaccharide biosynthesis regulator YciM